MNASHKVARRMNTAEQVGAIHYWLNRYKDQLSSSRFEVRRLGAIIRRAVADFDDCKTTEEFQVVVERLDNEMRHLAQCECGKLWSDDQLTWITWEDLGVESAECLVCRKTMSRTQVK